MDDGVGPGLGEGEGDGEGDGLGDGDGGGLRLRLNPFLGFGLFAAVATPLSALVSPR